MFNRFFQASLIMAALTAPARAEPPANLDQCIKLWGDTGKAAGEKIKSEAEYAKYYLKQLDLQSACGARDFAGAEKIAAEIRSTFHLD